MKLFKRKRNLIGLIVFGSFQLTAQNFHVNKVWETETTILGQQRFASSIIDQSGNILNVSNRQNNNSANIYLNKLNGNGNLDWQQEINNLLNIAGTENYGTDIKKDASGNIYICGANFNGLNYDYLIAKYSSSGTQIWRTIYNGTGNLDDVPSSLEVDGSGNVYVTGGSFGATSLSDFVTLKLNGNSGAIVWNKRYDFSNKYELATKIKIDNLGNIFVCGGSAQNQFNSDFVVIKYNPTNGNQLQIKRHNTPGNGYDVPIDMEIDNNNNVFVIGTANANLTNKDIKTIAYDQNLNVNWVKYVDASGREDEAGALSLDNLGNIWIIGQSKNALGEIHMLSEKYNKVTGEILWTQNQIHSAGITESKGMKIKTDPLGNVFTLSEIIKNGTTYVKVSSFDNLGNLRWQRINENIETTNEKAIDIIVKDNEVFVTTVKESGEIQTLSTIKYSIGKRPSTIENDANGNPSHIKGAVLVRFSKNHLNLDLINNKEFESGLLEEFVTEALLKDMEIKAGFSWNKFNAFKIHRRATTADSLSITRLGDTIKLPNFWASLLIEIPFDVNELEICDKIDTLDYGIYHATPNYLGYLLENANDELYTLSQYSLYPNSNFPSSSINARDAWEIETGQDNVRVGVYDQIVDWSHPDFGDGTLEGSKVVDGFNYAFSTFEFGNLTSLRHGTAVAGIIGALRNNLIGVAGIAGGDVSEGNTGAQLLSFGIISGDDQLMQTDQGVIDYATISEAIVEGSSQTTAGYGYGLHIQNHSWGMDIPGTADFREAFEIAFKNHCISVAARGNEGDANPAAWPACFDDEKVLTVVASGTDGHRKSTFNGQGNWSSSYGRDGSGNSTRCDVDVLAPGVSELVGTTRSTNGANYPYDNCYNNDNSQQYTCFSGTSAAAPHVSGVAALMCSHHNIERGYYNNLSTEDVEAILEKTTVPVDGNGYHLESGYGLMDANRALMQVDAPYNVRHMIYGPNQASLTPTQTLNNVTIYFATNYGIPNGTTFYESKRYEVVWNINETLNSTNQIVDWWELTASQRVGKSNNVYTNNNPYTNLNLNVEIGGNTVSGTATTYTYALKQSPLSPVQWYPINPNDLQFAYSLHLINPTLALSEQKSTEYALFPNPSNNSIRLKTNNKAIQNGEVKIFDTGGRLILSKDVASLLTSNGDLEVDLSEIENGLYYFSLISNNEIVTKSFVILH